MKTFAEIQKHTNDILKRDAELKTMQARMDKMVLMEWIDKPGDRDDFKFTTSPDARNAYMGALRLMTGADPIISVPKAKNDFSKNKSMDLIEKLCKSVWYLSGRFAQRPVHYDLMGQLLRYDEFHLAIKDTEAMFRLHEKGSKAEQHRFRKVMETTPYIFQALDVKRGHFESDGFGTTAYFSQTGLTYYQALSIHGEKVLKDAGIIEPTSSLLYYNDYWDLEVHVAWISLGIMGLLPTANANEDALVVGKKDGGKHNLPCIPIVCQVAEASQLEEYSRHRRQPLLYAVDKAGYFERLNMMGTMAMTNLFNIALNPAFKHMRSPNNPESELEISFDDPISVVHLPPGDDLQPMMREAISMDLQKGELMVKDKFNASTIYPQALGEPMGGQQTFSTVSLLSQQGRLPLISYQRAASWGLGTAFETMIDLMKDKKDNRTVQFMQEKLEVVPDDIPENLIIDVRIDADLPQDQAHNATVAQILQSSGLASNNFIRENILNVPDATSMEEEIMLEKFSQRMIDEMFNGEMRQQIEQEVMQKIQQRMMQQQQQQQQQRQEPPPGTEPGGPEIQGPPEGTPPEERAPQEPPGVNSFGGLPPSFGGMMPAFRPGQKPAPVRGYNGGWQRGER